MFLKNQGNGYFIRIKKRVALWIWRNAC